MPTPPAPSCNEKSSRLAAALRQGLLLGAALLIAPAFAAPSAAGTATTPKPAVPKPAVHKAAGKKTSAAKPQAKAGTHARSAHAGGKALAKTATAPSGKQAAKNATANAALLGPGTLADFGGKDAPHDVVHVANWVSYTHNNGFKPFIVVDKKMARVWVFDPKGKLKHDSEVLLGLAKGDDPVAGVGNKPLSQIDEKDKTTPAGRFIAARGKNNHGDDVIWIDYQNAVSMHKMHSVSADEHRAERMATADVSDNRISNGCVNVPPPFFNSVLWPMVSKTGAVIYVLPETRTPQQQFGSFDVPPKGAQVAQAEK